MTFFELVQKFYAPVAAAFKPKPAEPVAMQMLHDFKGFAAKIDAFRNSPNEGAKYLYRRDNGPFPTDDYMGIAAGWLNAVSMEGRLNGRAVESFHGDPNGAAFSWVHGSPPGYYVAPATIADGATVLRKYLSDMSAASAYLQGLGLTADAVAKA